MHSDARGGVDLDHLREVIAGGDIAGLMLTNPNTLGLFDEHIVEIATLITDDELTIVAEGPDLVIHATDKQLDHRAARIFP